MAVEDLRESQYRDYFAEYIEESSRFHSDGPYNSADETIGGWVVDSLHSLPRWQTLPVWLRDKIEEYIQSQRGQFELWLEERLEEEARNR